MAGLTLEQAEARLTLYLTAEDKVLTNQSYEIDGRKLTRADLGSIQKGIELWQGRVDKLSARSGSGGRGYHVQPER
ncbi:MAG: hypothetical protein Alpg2KO_31510 [Alphaproteobacteria bacterium]